MNKSESINELADALSKFQGEVQDAERTSKSYTGKYAKLEDIFSIIRPRLAKHGLSFVQVAHSENGKEIKIDTMLMHKSGQYISGSLTIDVPAPKGQSNALQEVGKAMSYAKRYAIMGMAGMCQKDEDNDADTVGKETAPTFKKAEKKEQPAQQVPVSDPNWKMTLQDTESLEFAIQKAGYQIERICERYSIKDLKELNEEQYQQTIRICNKAITEKGAQ